MPKEIIAVVRLVVMIVVVWIFGCDDDPDDFVLATGVGTTVREFVG